jgi:hypothetical protein
VVDAVPARHQRLGLCDCWGGFDVKLMDALGLSLLALGIMMTALSFFAVRGPAAEVQEFIVPKKALEQRPYSYWVPLLPQPSISMVLSCVAARRRKAA